MTIDERVTQAVEGLRALKIVDEVRSDNPLARDAATLITDLHAALKEARRQRDDNTTRYADTVNRLCNERDELKAALKESERERDEANQDREMLTVQVETMTAIASTRERQFSSCRVLRNSAEAKRDALAADLERAREDAERWRALMASKRMHFMGCAGFDITSSDGSKKLAQSTAVPRRDDNQHFGMEFWREYPPVADPDLSDRFERDLLTAYVDDIRSRAAFLASGEKPE